MAVLKDMQCARCGALTEAMVDGAKSVAKTECARCGVVTMHRSICNGGRSGHISWGTTNMSRINDHIRYEGVKAGFPRQEDIGTPNESRNATPVCDKAGDAIHDRQTFIADGLAERRAKRDAERHRRRYGAKVQIG